MRDELADRKGEELDLLELLRVLWQRKWFLLPCAALSVSAAFIYVLNARTWYRAEAVVMQAEQGSLPGALSQFGGLASLAGIRMAGESNAELPLAVLRSRDFSSRFVATAKVDESLLTEGLLRSTPEGRKAAGDEALLANATDYFRENVLTIADDKKTGLITVSMRWVQSHSAAEWANAFVELLNERLRAQAIAEAEQNVGFLRQALGEAAVPALQQSIGRVLESEMQKLLLAKSNGEFAFRVIDRAVVPREPVAPRRLMILALSLGLGSALGVAIALGLHLAASGRRTA